MTNKEKVLSYIRYMAPNRVTNGDIQRRTGISSHPSESIRFLVFGNDSNVPKWWLARYGHLIDGISVFFIHGDGELEILNG